MARYGDAPDSENPPKPGETPKYTNTAEFNLDAPALQPRNANFSAMNYTVAGGETLKTIARNVLGDSGLWWRIAQANGLSISGDGALQAGQTLSIPRVTLNANNADTFQPYDPSRITGSTEPSLPAPAAQSSGGGCGGLGKVIMVVVAVVATIYTAGALAPAAAGAGTGFSATMATGASVLGGSAGLTTGSAFAIGAASGAAGSIASQAAGNLLGVQDGFNWKGVGLSALSGGIAGGLGTTALAGGAGWQDTALRMAATNALTQGVGVITGLQRSFDWRGVAASAAGAAAGQAAGQSLGSAVGSTDWSPLVKDLVTRTGAGLAAGTVASIAQGGRVSVQQVATDAFGNALGWSVAGASLATPQSASADGKSDWVANMKAWRSVPGVQLAQNMTGGMVTSRDDSANMLGIALPQTDPVLPEVVVRATNEERWSSPFADPARSAAQWTVSNITGIARGATLEQLNSPNIYNNAQLIRATQGPSSGNVLQKAWNSPDVQGVAQRSGVGIIAAGIVQTVGDAWAGATGYNPVNNQYYSPLEQQQAMWGTVATIAPLGASVKVLSSERGALGNTSRANEIGVPATRSANPLSPVLETDTYGNEIYYRTMKESHYRTLERDGVLTGTGETSLAPLEAYSAGYDGALVRITVKPGTSAQLQHIGIAANAPAAAEFPVMSTRTGAWNQTNARFKVEATGVMKINDGLGVMNTQLGKGSALDIFNANLLNFERLN